MKKEEEKKKGAAGRLLSLRSAFLGEGRSTCRRQPAFGGRGRDMSLMKKSERSRGWTATGREPPPAQRRATCRGRPLPAKTSFTGIEARTARSPGHRIPS